MEHPRKHAVWLCGVTLFAGTVEASGPGPPVPGDVGETTALSTASRRMRHVPRPATAAGGEVGSVGVRRRPGGDTSLPARRPPDLVRAVLAGAGCPGCGCWKPGRVACGSPTRPPVRTPRASCGTPGPRNARPGVAPAGHRSPATGELSLPREPTTGRGSTLSVGSIIRGCNCLELLVFLWETGSGLTLLPRNSGAREYEARTGRWTRKDPIGLAGDGGVVCRALLRCAWPSLRRPAAGSLRGAAPSHAGPSTAGPAAPAGSRRSGCGRAEASTPADADSPRSSRGEKVA
jgi:hypothetical protein